MRCPSGDQDGDQSPAELSVKRAKPNSSVSFAYISVSPSLLDANTTLRPLGDQDGL